MALAASPASFSELRARGNRAILQSQHAMRDFRILCDECASLRQRIDRIHHQGRWEFEANLAFFQAEGPLRRVTR